MSDYLKCKACDKLCPSESLLRHIVHSKKDCKSVYGDDFVDNWALENARKRRRKYKEKNKEAIRKQNADYKFLHKESIAAMNAEYYENNKEKFQKKYQDNKEEIKKRYKENKAIHNAKCKKRREEKHAREMREMWHDYYKSSLFDLEKDTREQNSMKKEETYYCLKKAFAQFPKLLLAMLYNNFARKIDETYKQLEEDCDSMFERMKLMDEDNDEEVKKLYYELAPKVEGDYCGYGPVGNWQDPITDQLEVSYSKVWVDGLSQQVRN